jgi:hypothetical protein
MLAMLASPANVLKTKNKKSCIRSSVVLHALERCRTGKWIVSQLQSC